MNESILNSVKKRLGIDAEYKYFDEDIIMEINTVFLSLFQMGIGPTGGFRIEDENDTWDSFIDNAILLEAVKTYISLQVRLAFDPPSSSSVTDAIKQKLSEVEWRLFNVAEYRDYWEAQ